MPLSPPPARLPVVPVWASPGLSQPMFAGYPSKSRAALCHARQIRGLKTAAVAEQAYAVPLDQSLRARVSSLASPHAYLRSHFRDLPRPASPKLMLNEGSHRPWSTPSTADTTTCAYP